MMQITPKVPKFIYEAGEREWLIDIDLVEKLTKGKSYLANHWVQTLGINILNAEYTPQLASELSLSLWNYIKNNKK